MMTGQSTVAVWHKWPQGDLSRRPKDGQADGDRDAMFELNVNLGEEGDGLILRFFPAILCDMKLKMACKRGKPREPGHR